MVGCVNTKTGPPPHWDVSVWPDGWDFERDYYPDPNLTQVGYVLLPARFHMVLHWPDLMDGKSEHGGALIVGFEARDGELEFRELYGVDMDVEKWIGHLVQEFPPDKWKSFAVAEITRFLALDEDPQEAAKRAASAMQVVDLRKRVQAEPKVGRKRHRITEEHLAEVAGIYADADARGEPPTLTVAGHFGVAHSTAAKWVGKARDIGLLKPALKKSR